MRHRKRGRKLSRTSAHRKATRQNLAKALLEHERIVTTPAKAKDTRPFVEKLITLARKAQPYKYSEDKNEKARYLHYYRLALKKLQDKAMVQKLFGEGPWRESGSLAERYAERPGGQTRIIRLSGSRLGTPMGYAVEDVTELNFELAGKERKLKLIGNRLGDNSKQVVFELIRENEEALADEAAAPEISVQEESDGSAVAQEAELPEDSAEISESLQTGAEDEEVTAPPDAESESDSEAESDAEQDADSAKKQ